MLATPPFLPIYLQSYSLLSTHCSWGKLLLKPSYLLIIKLYLFLTSSNFRLKLSNPIFTICIALEGKLQ